MRILLLSAIAAIWNMTILFPAAAQNPGTVPLGTVAFLGITYIDTSTEGAYFDVREDETARLALIEEAVRQDFRDRGFSLVDLAPVSAQLSNIVNPAKCYGCELRMAAELNADYVLVGEVQKVSNLILSMNLVLRNVGSGQTVRARSVDIRSNTDKSWLRGVRYILNEYFFKS